MGWTTQEAAEYLGMERAYVGWLCNQHLLNCKKHGRDWDIDPESVKAYKLKPKNKGGRPRKVRSSK